MTAATEPSIHVLMARVVADLPAIGKNQFNKQQGFKFRGIDDVLDALNPVLSKHGVFFVPDVVDRVAEERPTKSGGVLYTVHLHVRYRFYGPNGDYVEASGWGEGTDSGDKATNKAMTGAMKYVLFQVFAISTDEQSANDADNHVPEATRYRDSAADVRSISPDTVSDSQRKMIFAVLRELDITERDEQRKKVADILGREVTAEAPMTKAEASTVIDALAALKEAG